MWLICRKIVEKSHPQAIGLQEKSSLCLHISLSGWWQLNYFLFFTPQNWGKITIPFWRRIFFRWVGSTKTNNFGCLGHVPLRPHDLPSPEVSPLKRPQNTTTSLSPSKAGRWRRRVGDRFRWFIAGNFGKHMNLYDFVWIYIIHKCILYCDSYIMFINLYTSHMHCVLWFIYNFYQFIYFTYEFCTAIHI